MALDRKVFYDKVRKTVFNGRISPTQLEGMEKIINTWLAAKGADYRHLAYILATAKRECNFNLRIREVGRGKGKKYGIPHPVTKQVYYGRGPVQITWYDNYKKFTDLLGIDLVNNPDRALDPDIGVLILLEGMYKGISKKGDFTKYCLEDYINDKKEDPINARRIVNGTDHAKEITNTYYAFKDALKESGMIPMVVAGALQIVLEKVLPRVLTANPNVANNQIPNIIEQVKAEVRTSEPIQETVKPKSALASSGIWGGLGAVFTGLFGAYTAYQMGSMEGVTAGLGGAFSGLVAIYGRITAKRPVGSVV